MTLGVLAMISIISVSVITYLPAIDNFFISDDFTLLSMVKVLDRFPMYIFQATSEMFRLVTYVYFWSCFKLFGMHPEPYYWSSIALHALISLLVYQLVKKISGQPLAGVTAALFFATYERHQEAVMWISAANEIILTLNCLLFLLLWEHSWLESGFRKTCLALMVVVFGLALFSKEASVALAPLVVIRTMLQGHSARTILRRCSIVLLMAGMFGLFWLSQADRNFFITQGHYALGWQFLPVYLRSSLRLLSQTVPFIVTLLIVKNRSADRAKETSAAFRNPAILFFAALLLLAVAPYAFLTYSNVIPSRNSYFPSVGLAGINGILFASMYAGSSIRARRFSVLFLSLVLTGNIAYVWLKKDPQYVDRAAPTRALIEILNRPGLRQSAKPPFNICGFPLHSWIGSETVAGFTSFTSHEVLFPETCEPAASGTNLIWNEEKRTYNLVAR